MTEAPGRFPTAAKLAPCVIRALRALGGVASNRQIEDFVAAEFRLSPEERSLPHSKQCQGGRTELGYRIA